MHEFSLYSTVSQKNHGQIKQQLAGVARMQPKDAVEVHLLFKAKPPAGLSNLPSAGGSQGVMQQDVQRIKTMLNASMYYIQLVGQVVEGIETLLDDHPTASDVMMADADVFHDRGIKLRWTLEFKDTPDPGKQNVSSRLISRTPLDSGNLVPFLESFGYEYVSRYYVRGCHFYDHDTTLFLYEIFQQSQGTQDDATNISTVPPFGKLIPVDPGRKYVLQASINVVDGNHPELKDRAIKQLLAMKSALRQAVTLTPGDRLALDTKVPIARKV